MEKLYYELSMAAARQYGFVTRAQAVRLGADRVTLDHLEEAKLLLEFDDDVFQLPSSSMALKHAYPYTAWLALMPDRFRWERPQTLVDDAVLSHESAARLHGIGTMALSRTVFTAPRKYVTPHGVNIHVGHLLPEDVMVVEGVPVTTPYRTILDLVRGHVDGDDLGRVLADAVRQDMVDLQTIYQAMVPLAAEFNLPVGGSAFLANFLPDLVPTALSVRNLRGYAGLTAPEDVTRVQGRIMDALADLYGADETVEALSRDVAAEVVGHLHSR